MGAQQIAKRQRTRERCARRALAIAVAACVSCASPHPACRLLDGLPIRYAVQRSTETWPEVEHLAELGVERWPGAFVRVRPYDADLIVVLSRHRMQACDTGELGCLISEVDELRGCKRHMVAWVDLALDDVDILRVSQHEAGHALGMREGELP